MAFELKQAIAGMDEKQLRAAVLDLANLRKENAKWLCAKLKGAAGRPEALQHYKRKIRAALFENKPNLRAARQAVSDFKKICREPAPLLELMVYYVETSITVENEYGDLYDAFYSSMESMFQESVTLLKNNPNVASQFKPRLQSIVNNSTDGYGHKDTLEELYEELKPGGSK